MMRDFFISIIVFFFLAGCSGESRPQVTGPIKLTNTQPATLDDLQSIIDRDGAITFLSFNGEWIGTDIDSSYTFFNAGQVHLTRYGITIIHHEGQYSFDGSSVKLVIRTGKPDQQKWDFDFELGRDGDDLVLISEDKTETGSFRQVDAESNQSTVNAINDWKKQINAQPPAVE